MTHEYRIVATLVPRVAAGTVLILVVGTFITHNNTATMSANKPIYLSVLALAVVLTVMFIRGHRSGGSDAVVSVLAAVGLTWGIWTIERPGLLSSYWEGFGYRVAIASLALVLLLGTRWDPRHLPRAVRIGVGVVVCACCLCAFLGAIRTGNYMQYVNNNVNEINDMLGPVVGRAPESTFIPAYTALYGWIFVPFKSAFSPVGLVAAMSIFLTALDLVTVLVATWIAKRALGVRGFILPLALVVPITYVTSHVAGDASSIGGLFQEVPIRLLSGFLIAAVGLKDLVLVYRGTVRAWPLFLIGALCGVVAWNSQDFGVAAALVYGAMILVGATQSARKRGFGVWFGGLCAGIASYPLFLLAIGRPLNLGFVGVFIKEFGPGFYSAPIQVPGPVLIIMPILICSAAAGWALMRTRRAEGVSENAVLDRATLTVTFVGTWAVLCLVYYINRAYAAGQLQTMLLPCGVCIAGLLSVALHTEEVGRLWQAKDLRAIWRTRAERARMLPLGLFVGVCFASVLLIPYPVTAARNLVSPPPMSGFTTYDLPQVLSAVETARAFTAGKPGELTYLGESFNYVALATGVPSNALLFPFPYNASSAVTQLACVYLRAHHSRWLVVSSDGVKAFGQSVCGIYQPIALPGLASGQLQELK